MKVRLPKSGGMGNINNMAAKIQDMQKKMEEKTKEIEEKEFDFTSGGGIVKIKIKGNFEVTDLYISPEIIDKDDATMLQETIIAAFNGALKMVKDFKDSSMQDITKGMDLPTNIPGLF